MTEISPYYRRHVWLLSGCWALNSMSNMLLVTFAVMCGHVLAEDKSLAALPVALQWLGTAAMVGPASFFMRRFGRRAGFWCSNATVIIGAALAIRSLFVEDFALFCIGLGLVGLGNGFIWYYRFAAAEVAPESYKSRAVSYLLAGGVVAALLGRPLANNVYDLFAPVAYAGAFATMIALNCAIAFTLLFVRVPRPSTESLKGGRPMLEIARQPSYMVALFGGLAAYATMVMLMSVTPLAMKLSRHVETDATYVIQWHVLGMYVPSFFTGHLIRWFGELTVMLVGSAVIALCIVIGALGTTIDHFWVALALLGLGWNFLYTGATVLLTETYSVAERAKAQAMNEMVIFFGVALATFFSGSLLLDVGWRAVNLAALPGIVLVACAIISLMIWRARRGIEAPAHPGE